MRITSPKPAIGVHLEQTAKSALERAARADSRSVSSMAAKIITDWLRREGFQLIIAIDDMKGAES
jgi:hypothetical protein